MKVTQNSKIYFRQTHACSLPAQVRNERTYGTSRPFSIAPLGQFCHIKGALARQGEGGEERERERNTRQAAEGEAAVIYLPLHTTPPPPPLPLRLAWEYAALFVDNALQHAGATAKFFARRKDQAEGHLEEAKAAESGQREQSYLEKN